MSATISLIFSLLKFNDGQYQVNNDIILSLRKIIFLIILLLTCLKPNFQGSLPHQYGIADSLQPKPFLQYTDCTPQDKIFLMHMLLG